MMPTLSRLSGQDQEAVSEGLPAPPSGAASPGSRSSRGGSGPAAIHTRAYGPWDRFLHPKPFPTFRLVPPVPEWATRPILERSRHPGEWALTREGGREGGNTGRRELRGGGAGGGGREGAVRRGVIAGFLVFAKWWLCPKP